jgi:23S rRNA (cytosine1962-C5)-methyltransferase
MPDPVHTIYLKAGRERSVLQKHPWLYSGAVERVEGNPQSGQTLQVISSKGDPLGWAAYSPESQIRLRFWSFDPNDRVDRTFLADRISKAITLRDDLSHHSSYTNAYRLIHAESDNLPGLIVDRYADYLVVQILSAGIEYWRNDIIEILANLCKPVGIFERSDVSVRSLEGLEPRTGCLVGKVPADRLQIMENGLKFWVDIKGGQKTGFYLDQRDNRQKLADSIKGGSVLNCFAYTGGFTVYALKAGAEKVLSLDSSAEALQFARENVLLNDFQLNDCEWQMEDVFSALRGYRDRAISFDTIILDPPKFAPTASLAQKAARAYKDINLLAFKLLNPAGTLFTFSCSGGINNAFFQKIIAEAAFDAGVDAKILAYLHQGSDHPVSLNFPEGAYLKGLVCRI